MSRSNNFGLIRLVAAFGVLYFHVYVLTGRGPEQPLAFTHWLTPGSIAVKAFFVISGYLLTKSFLNREDLLQFLVARFLRIWPALAATVLVTVAFIGPMSTQDSHYFTHPGTYEYLRTVLIFDLRQRLPGVFATNPYADVNGSLWTLPYEVLCYGVLFVSLAFAIGLRKLESHVSVRRIWILWALIYVYSFWAILTFRTSGDPVFFTINTAGVFDLLVFFAAGVIAAGLNIKGNGKLDVVALLVLFTTLFWSATDWRPYLVGFGIAFPYLLLRIAYARVRPFEKFFRKYDISYGVYLYSCPITQLVVFYLGIDRSIFLTTVVVVALTFPLAFLSWLIVERPAIDLGRAAGARGSSARNLRHPV